MYPPRPIEQLAEGMTVFDAAGDKLGTLVRFAPCVLVVEHGFFFPTAYYVPMTAVACIDADGVWLTLATDDVPRQPWDGATPADALVDLAGAPG